MGKNSLTSGSIYKGIIMFMIPLIIGNVFQQAYSLVDAIIVGQTLGDLAFTGVGCTSSATFLVLGFASGLTAGLTVPTAQYYGAKDYDKLKKSVATGFILSAIISIILTIISLICARPLLELLKTSPSLMEHAYNYLITIFAGITVTVFYNIVCFILRAVGDSKTPLYALIIASVLNIGFDFLFILGFKMGTEGAGWATLLSQLISGLICIIYMFIKYPFLRLKKDDFKVNSNFVIRHLKISIPLAFQYSIIAIGLMVQQGAVNGLDKVDGEVVSTLYATSYSAASKITGFGNTIISALGTTMATYCGQNFGAGNLDRIKKGFKDGMIVGVCLSVFLAIIIIPFGKYMLRIFLPTITPEIEDTAQLYLLISCLLYVFLAAIYVYRSGLQGLGESNITVIAGILELIMRVLASILLAQFFGWTGICYSDPAAWIGADLILIPAIIYFLHKYDRLAKENKFGLTSK